MEKHLFREPYRCFSVHLLRFFCSCFFFFASQENSHSHYFKPVYKPTHEQAHPVYEPIKSPKCACISPGLANGILRYGSSIFRKKKWYTLLIGCKKLHLKRRTEGNERQWKIEKEETQNVNKFFFVQNLQTVWSRLFFFFFCLLIYLLCCDKNMENKTKKSLWTITRIGARLHIAQGTLRSRECTCK